MENLKVISGSGLIEKVMMINLPQVPDKVTEGFPEGIPGSEQGPEREIHGLYAFVCG